MIYVVTMFARAGSTMLCQALEAGGLEVVKANARYELEFPRELKQAGWPLMYDGKALKIPFAWIHNLIPHRYKVIAMLRNAEEIQRSYLSAFGTAIDRELVENRTNLALEFLRWRGDVELTVAQYVDVLNQPRQFFESLAHNGWPIDPRKAAAVVDPAMYRVRTSAQRDSP
jgi:hypothetical protein